MSRTNRQFLLAKRPSGEPTADTFERVEQPVGEPGAGQVLIKNLFLSLDPAMRGWMNEGKSYIKPIGIGEVIRALGVGEVVASNHPDFKTGDTVNGMLGIQDYYLGDPQGFYKVDPSKASLPQYLSVLGMTGLTAYFGLLEVGEPKAGQTIVVSGAAGAVGSMVGQIGKLKACHVVGIAGGAEKCRYLIEELGFDAAIDYKAEPDLAAALRRECPNGIDVYFDNVGGETLDAVLTQINFRARVVLCGAISQYNSDKVQGPQNYLALLSNRARMEGFIVLDHAAHYAEAQQQLAIWLADGQLKSREHVVEGLDTFPETLMKLFSGENFGKLVLKV